LVLLFMTGSAFPSYYPNTCIRRNHLENLKYVYLFGRAGKTAVTEYGTKGFASGDFADCFFADVFLETGYEVAVVVCVDSEAVYRFVVCGMESGKPQSSRQANSKSMSVRSGLMLLSISGSISCVYSPGA